MRFRLFLARRIFFGGVGAAEIGRSCGAGKEEKGGERSSLMLLVRVSGSEERSQNTHGEQPE